jgi:GNAT superfamily N-acetyltransferase
MIDRNSMEYAAEKSIADLCIKVAAVTGGSAGSSDFSCYARNPLSEWHSKVFYIDIPEGLISERISILTDNIRKGALPKILLFSSRIINESLERCLLDNAFTKFHEQTGMYIELGDLAFDEKELPAGIKVMNDESRIEEWVRTAGAAFGKANDPTLFKILFKEDAIKYYACFSDDKIIATAFSYICDGIAGIHMVGTLEELRGRGLATGITKKILMDTQSEGCKLCTLQASKLGRPVYEKIGFKAVSDIIQWKIQV